MYFVIWFDGVKEREHVWKQRWQAEKFAEELADDVKGLFYIDVYENDTLLLSYGWSGKSKKYLLQKY